MQAVPWMPEIPLAAAARTALQWGSKIQEEGMPAFDLVVDNVHIMVSLYGKKNLMCTPQYVCLQIIQSLKHQKDSLADSYSRKRD
jgi:hypothetical protein